MKLLEQILKDTWGDTGNAFTVIPSCGGYFKSVKRVEEYTPCKIVIFVAKYRLVVTGENLTIDKYYGKDLALSGSITGVCVE